MYQNVLKYKALVLPSLKKHKMPLLLVVICVLLSMANYTPGTWQTGWDTLHPEFNWAINIPRHLFGMWQENQGLGNVGGHSHAADMSRILFLYLSSFFLPLNFLRYFYLFMTLIAGPLGVYFFVKQVLLKDEKFDGVREAASFLGALYYLFNLGTLQQYYVQLEMYTALYGFLPWVYLYACKVVDGDKKSLLWLAIACVIAAPHAYAVTVFVSLFLCLVVLLFGNSLYLFIKGDRAVVKRFIAAVVVVIVMNSYWLFPSLYFGVNHSAEVSQSKINRHFSGQIFAYNQKYGNLRDLLLVRGFLMDWRNFDFDRGSFYMMMKPWREYFASQPATAVVEIVLVGVMVFGFFVALLRHPRFSIGLGLTFLLCAFMFMTTNPPFGPVFVFVRSQLKVLAEMFRNPFTKFSVELMFVYSCFFAYGVLALLSGLKKVVPNSQKAMNAFVAVFLVAFVYYMYPMFDGKLVSKDIRLDIPNYYFSLFDYMNKQPDDRRVATLPIHSFWGWTYYEWGYQGAGFIWFGMKQPVLDRDFDRWNRFNEEYYNEMSNAVYAEDIVEVESVVKKYGIGYVLLDESVIATEQSSGAPQIEKTRNLLDSSSLLKKDAVFGSVTVYKNTDGRENSFYTQNSESSYDIDFTFKNSVKPFEGGRQKLYRQGDKYILENVLTLQNGNYALDLGNFFAKERYTIGSVFARSEANKVFVKVRFSLPEIVFDTEPIAGFATDKEFEFSFDKNSSPETLALNDKFFFNLVGLSSEYKKVGGGLVKLSEGVKLGVYTSKEASVFNLISNLPTSIDCSDGPNKDIFTTEGYLSLISKESTACIEHLLTIKPGNYLFKTNFNYSSSLGSLPYYCIGLSKERCAAQNFVPLTRFSKDSYTEVTDFISGTYDGKNPYVKVYAPKDAGSGIAQGDYSKFIISVQPLLRESSISATEVKSLISDKLRNYSFVGGGDFTIRARVDADTFYYALQGKDLFEASNLEVIDDTQRKKIYKDGGVFIKETGGTTYESVNFTGVNNDVHYLVDIESFDRTGYPPALIVSDFESKKHFVYENLVKDNELFRLYRGSGRDTNKGYQVGFDVLSIGKVPSEVLVRSVKLTPYSGGFLSGVTIKNIGEDTVVTQPEVTKYAPFLYRVGGLNVGDLLVFESSFEKGWGVFGGSNHRLIKGWANGWDVDQPEVWILFAPAMLQLGGYILAGGMFILLVMTRKRL